VATVGTRISTVRVPRSASRPRDGGNSRSPSDRPRRRRDRRLAAHGRGRGLHDGPPASWRRADVRWWRRLPISRGPVSRRSRPNSPATMRWPTPRSAAAGGPSSAAPQRCGRCPWAPPRQRGRTGHPQDGLLPKWLEITSTKKVLISCPHDGRARSTEAPVELSGELG
jgi:hypothetical protein